MSNYYGYGIAVSDAMNPGTTAQLIDLLKQAPKFGDSCLLDLEAYIQENPEKGYKTISDIPVKESIHLINGDDMMDFTSVAPILQAVIYEAEGINLHAVKDLWTSQELLLFIPCYPWSLNKNERDLTTVSIQDIIMKYLSIVTNVSPSFQDYEWSE